MKSKTFITVFILVVLLASCAPGTASPVPTATITPLLTATIAPTIAPTNTPTQVTYLHGLNTDVPEPDTSFVDNVVNENYLSVMGLTRNQVVLSYKEHTGIDGQPYVVMVDDSTGVPLAVYFEGEWQKATLKFFGKQVGIVMGTDTLENRTKTEVELSKEFNRATIQVGNEWYRIEPKQGEIDSSQAQATEILIKTLRDEAGITDIVGHPIIWLYPDWLINGSFSLDQMRTIMQKRINYEITEHPDIHSWVVVNEPYLAGAREDDPFYKAWGNSYDYVIEAFQMARELSPDAILIFNDTDNHRAEGGTTKITREIVGKLQEKGFVNYLGMEMHFNQWSGVIDGKVDSAAITAEIDYYKKIGVPVLITELTYEPTETELNMTRIEFNQRLSSILGQIIKIAIDSGNVSGITFWGVTDKYIKDMNWYQIFDDNGQPKQAYYVVLRTLYEGIK